MPALAAQIALERAGLTVADVDRLEINEAFASVAVNSTRMLGISDDRVNVNGGAVALGHPVGASGARLIVTLIHELRRTGGGIGCAAICSGGGQGDAMVIEVPAAVGSERSFRALEAGVRAACSAYYPAHNRGAKRSASAGVRPQMELFWGQTPRTGHARKARGSRDLRGLGVFGSGQCVFGAAFIV